MYCKPIKTEKKNLKKFTETSYMESYWPLCVPLISDETIDQTENQPEDPTPHVEERSTVGK